jgi:diguanylate cyclase (GGDEF)-like protein/PAS domain S-box-containing protein
MAAMVHHLRRRPPERLYFRHQQTQNTVTADLLRRDNRKLGSLEWLSETEMRVGCLAIWDHRRPEQARRDTLTIVGGYVGDTPIAKLGERLAARSFPPASVVDMVDERAGEAVYVLPVRFDGSDWGLLALVGPVADKYDISIEMINHCIVMLTTAFDQERAVEEIRVSQERYALASDAANAGLWDWNLVTGAVYCSARWRELVGCVDDVEMTMEEWLGRVEVDDRVEVEQMLVKQLTGSASTLEVEHRVIGPDDSSRWRLTRSRSVRDGESRVTRLVCSMTDITDRKQLERQLRQDARYDRLTGLPNRVLFMERLQSELDRPEATGDHWFAVVFLDLDGFKLINDSLGHRAGDAVLVLASQRLSGQIRPGDMVSRFGGDEFVALLCDIRSISDLNTVIRRMLAALSEPMVIDGDKAVVGAAAGITLSLTGYGSADDMIRDADTAMYRAKALGGNMSQIFDPSMHTDAVTRLRLETDLRQAISHRQF